MDKKVPHKNIDPVLVDIKRPNFNYEKSMHGEGLNLSRVPQVPNEKNSRIIKRIVGGFSAILVILFITFAVSNFFQAKDAIKEAGAAITGNFSDSINALKNFEPDKATEYLKKNNEQIGTLDSLLKNRSGQTILSMIGNIIPAFKDTGTLVSQIAGLNFNFIQLSEHLSDLEQNGFKYFQSDGDKFLKILNETRNLMRGILEQIQSIKNVTTDLKKFSSVFDNIDKTLGSQYLTHSADLYRLQSFLDDFLSLIGSEDNHHIAVLFQNPAEIRPGGGFIGSYADITIRRGQMQSIDVRDIYDPDGWVTDKVVPPAPLQRTTKDWAARDANWFFDFPTSAKTVLGFLESSQFYKDRNTVFDGAIALNINVLDTLLDITGPVELPQYKLTITSNNFLEEIQREVEAGNDKKSGEPKRILKVLVPIMLGRLGNPPSGSQRALIEKIQNHIINKDIMFYAKSEKIENFLQYVNAGGSIYDLPNNFWGSYLAVVNANIAGGKSDAYISEDINAKIDVDTNGGSLTDVTITRTHTGNTQRDPWWKVTNQDYIQIYTTPASGLISIKGNNQRNSSSGFDYSANKYIYNADLKKLEDSKIFLNGYNTWALEDHGKKVFATWFTVPAGDAKALTLRYQTTYANPDIVTVGNKYTFIFEKQSGVANSLTATISAPLGYRWVEGGSAVYMYQNQNPEGRVEFNLTLGK